MPDVKPIAPTPAPEPPKPDKKAEPPAAAANLQEVLKKRNLVKEYEFVPGMTIRFRTISIFEYYLYLKWTSSKNFNLFKTKERLDLEMSLHNLALYLHSFADERAHPLAGTDFYAEYLEGRKRILGSPEGVTEVQADDESAPLDLEAPETRASKFEESLFRSFFDMLDHNYAAIGTLSEAALRVVMTRFQEFLSGYVNIFYDREYHKEAFSDVDLTRLVFSIDTQWPASLYDGMVKVVYTTLSLKASSVLESWIDNYLATAGHEDMSVTEYKHIRGIRHLAARIMSYNGRILGDPVLAKKRYAELDEESILKLFEDRLTQLYGLPYPVITLLQEAFAHLDDVITEKMNWGAVKN